MSFVESNTSINFAKAVNNKLWTDNLEFGVGALNGFLVGMKMSAAIVCAAAPVLDGLFAPTFFP